MTNLLAAIELSSMLPHRNVGTDIIVKYLTVSNIFNCMKYIKYKAKMPKKTSTTMMNLIHLG